MVQKIGFVYLLKAHRPFQEVYKIGCSGSVKNRLKTFAVRLPFKVSLIASHPSADMYGAEALWHGFFRHRRIEGEWFTLTSSEAQFVRYSMLAVSAFELIRRLDRGRPVDVRGDPADIDRLRRWLWVMDRACLRLQRRQREGERLLPIVNAGIAEATRPPASRT